MVGCATVVNKLLDVLSTVCLASNKGFNTSVRRSIKSVHLASFVTLNSLASPGLSYFYLLTETVFAFFMVNNIGFEPITVSLQGEALPK